MFQFLPPFIPDDERGKQSSCQICKKKFQVLNRSQHKCKRCFRSVCSECAPDRAKTYKQDGTTKAHRSCKKCEAETRLIIGYAGKQGLLKFGQDSDFTNLWVKRLNREKKPYSVIMAEYSQNLAQTNQSIQKFKRQSSVLFQQLPKSYNYSIRHFIELAKQNIPNSQVQQAITKVMSSVLFKVGSLQYFSELIYIVVFLLSFASQCHCYLILTGLFQKVYPQYQTIFRPKRDNLLVQETKSLVKLVEILLHTSQKVIMVQIKQYLDAQASKILKTLTINFCNFEVTLHLIHQTLQKVSYLQLYKGVAALVYLSRDLIRQRVPYEHIQRYILKNITLEDVKYQMSRFLQKQIDPSFKQTQDEIDPSNPTSQKLAALQQLSSVMQQELTKRKEQISQLNTKWNLAVKQVWLEKTTNAELKEQLCILGQRMDQLHTYQQLKSKYNDSLYTIKDLQQANRKLKIQINQLLADQQQKNKKLEQYKYLYENETDSLINLQTQNELLKLKLNAKNVVFETDHLQRQIMDKNRKIMDLESRLNSSQTKMKYFQKSIIDYQQQLSSKPVEKQAQVKTQSSCSNSDQMKEYKQQLQLCVATVKKQKQRLDSLDLVNKQYESKNLQLQQQRNNLKIQVQSLEQRLNQKNKLQEHDDKNIFQLLDEMIQSQQNVLNKNKLYKIKNKVKQCQQELKMKTLDLRLKGIKMDEYKTMMLSKQVKVMQQMMKTVLQQKQMNENNSQINQKQECLLF